MIIDGTSFSACQREGDDFWCQINTTMSKGDSACNMIMCPLHGPEKASVLRAQTTGIFFFFTDRLPPDVDEEALASKACGKYLSNSIESLQIAQSNRKPDQ